jgi:iron complex outermembrane receptor protein
MDGRMRLNGAIFHTDYEDMQVEVFNSVAPVTENVGSATIKGAELEMQAAPGAGWLIDLSVAYLDAEYDDINTEITLIGEDFEFERVPEWSSSVGVSKEFDMNSGGMVIVRVDWSYRDETYNDAFNAEILKTDSFSLWDASVRWTNTAENLSIILSGRNLTDEEFLITGVHGTAFQSFEGMYDRGQQWSAEARWEF